MHTYMRSKRCTCLFFHVVERIEHQQRLLQCRFRDVRHIRILQGVDQGCYVVPAKHGAEELHGLGLVHQRRRGFPLGNGRQEGRLDVGRLVDAGWDTLRQQVHETLFVARRWGLPYAQAQHSTGTGTLGVSASPLGAHANYPSSSAGSRAGLFASPLSSRRRLAHAPRMCNDAR